jgi:gliding motility-associated-like protein
VYVLPTPPVSISSADTACPDIAVRFVAVADTAYKNFNWSFGDGSQTASGDTVVFHAYGVPGNYNVTLIPDAFNSFGCIDSAAKQITIPAVKAGFTIDSSSSPVFIFSNASQYAVRYAWDFGDPASGAGNSSQLLNGSFDYGGKTGIYTICLTAFNQADCWDSVCKQISLIRIDTLLIIPNVFTPGNHDGKNDAFDIDILGFSKYELQIYNRWGTEVYRSDRDGTGNDGINWNGRDHNDGRECSEGVYYFIFNCRFITDRNDRTYHGTVTLIREKQ